MPCKCLLFHDTCDLTYRDEVDQSDRSKQSPDACPVAPPSFFNLVDNVCGVCKCPNGVPKRGVECTQNGAQMCASCLVGFDMNADETACSAPTTPTTTPKTPTNAPPRPRYPP